jgi:hypothetical protein
VSVTVSGLVIFLACSCILGAVMRFWTAAAEQIATHVNSQTTKARYRRKKLKKAAKREITRDLLRLGLADIW